MKKYAGIGSRETPPNILLMMNQLSLKLESIGYLLRSGGAVGADSAFEQDITNKEIFIANDATPESIEMASKYHPAWNKCSPWAKKLHGRNCMILLGHHLDSPVKFILCWTNNGNDVGGTGLCIRLAIALRIPIFNLFDTEVKDRMQRFIDDISVF